MAVRACRSTPRPPPRRPLDRRDRSKPHTRSPLRRRRVRSRRSATRPAGCAAFDGLTSESPRATTAQEYGTPAYSRGVWISFRVTRASIASTAPGASVRALSPKFTPSTAEAPGRRSYASTASSTPGARGSSSCPRSSAITTSWRRLSPRMPADRRSRRRSATPRSPTRSSARWTTRASRPRTSSGTRSAATWRSSSPRAGGRRRSWRSPPAGGWAPGDESYKETLGLRSELLDILKAAAPHADAVLASPEGRRRGTQLITTNFEHIPTELREGWRLDAERITCPVRVVWGTADRLLPWPSAAARFRKDWLLHADWVELREWATAPSSTYRSRPPSSSWLHLSLSAQRLLCSDR